MAKSSCNIYTFNLCEAKREKNEPIIKEDENGVNIVFFENDRLDDFEAGLSSLIGNSSFIYSLRKRFSTSVLSFLSVIVIMFALISASIYEDLLKKLIFELPFSWEANDTISLFFVILFFFGLVMMPSILDGESSQLKDILQSWFNKDTRRLKRLKLAFSQLDKKKTINLYNIDLCEEEHWIFRLVVKAILNRFYNVNFFIRNDQVQTLKTKLKAFDVLHVDIIKSTKKFDTCSIEPLLSAKEQKLYALLQLSSSLIIKDTSDKKYISLELFEYCGRNFVSDEKVKTQQLISGFQNFINRAFDDFKLLKQENSTQIYFSSNVKYKSLAEEQRRLSYYLRNHIEECIEYFDNPISLLILYYYVKDIVLDKKRYIAILEKFLYTVEKKQHYELIEKHWFKIAGKMFDPSSIESFQNTQESIYRELSIESLNRLIFLFERNGQFEQALLIAKYLYEINPNKYAVNICSLYERMGQFDLAFNSLPKELELTHNNKPEDTQVRYFQRKAWIIVSQRRETNKQEGLDSIEKLKQILFCHNEDNEPLWLWHYYNIKANYAEWAGDYELAIKYYQKCLSIPALGAFEYGATFVNMAIAYRFKYLTSSTQNSDTILESIKIGKIGLLLKASVGDKDELPVVMHNQALNVLTKCIKEEFSTEQLKEADELTQNGIAILDETNSIKRLGMLLIESYILCCLLKKDVNSCKTRLEEHWKLMDENEHKQIIELYKAFTNEDKIQRIDFLDNLI